MAAMNAEERALLLALLRELRVAHLGTLRDGAPMVSMTLFLPAADLSVFHVHVSRLAWHTQDMARDPRVALSMAQSDDGRGDPFTLARVTLRGDATRLPNDGAAFDALKRGGSRATPRPRSISSWPTFPSGRSAPESARFVAGFGRVHNLSAQALAEAAASSGTDRPRLRIPLQLIVLDGSAPRPRGSASTALPPKRRRRSPPRSASRRTPGCWWRLAPR